jgi:arylsulfatase A-like enzyme
MRKFQRTGWKFQRTPSEGLNATRHKNASTPNALDLAWCNRDKSWKTWDIPLMRDNQVIEKPVDQRTITQRYTEEAVQIIEAQDGPAPFFLYIAHTMPHVPLFVSDSYYRSNAQEAMACVLRELDDSVGAVIDALDKRKLSENTLIIISSDNGPWTQKEHHGGSSGSLRGGKHTIFEGGLRVPAILYWPRKIGSGQVKQGLASTIDLFPSLAELAGVPVGPDWKGDGIAMGRFLFGNDPTSPRQEFYYYDHRQTPREIRGLRDSRWKLILDGQDNSAMLFDLSCDDGESKNMAADYPELVRGFILRIEAKQRDVGKKKGIGAR